jgi:transposase InsO family protein
MSKKKYSRLFRQRFVDAWSFTRREVTFAEHCARFGVSRQAGYEWLERFDEAGPEGLDSKSSAPRTCPHATSDETARLIVNARLEHPTWGPKKLKAWIEDQFPWEIELPAPSTIGDILKRAGLIPTKKRRARVARFTHPIEEALAPNDVWTTDFKGQFRTGDGKQCYPLTLADSFSRYLLRCDAYLSPNALIRASFESAFIEYGLPTTIRSDNGTPFASGGAPGGLSALSVWWIRLGIVPERIAPGSPWQNGRHERMHRTLKAEATQPAQWNRKQQQRTFDAFRHEYNHERPHESLGQETPGDAYAPTSHRPYRKKLLELEYPRTYQLRRVNDVGVMSWAGKRVFLSTVLRDQVVGVKQIDDVRYELYFGPVMLGIFNVSKRSDGFAQAKRRRRTPNRC